jgi:hypothetical protein
MTLDRVLIMEGTPGPVPDSRSEYIEVESCHSIWYFDITHKRFRRVLHGFDGLQEPPATEWRPYFRIEESVGSDSFVVWLNPSGTRLLRSWRHHPGCSCHDHLTGEVPEQG